MNQLIPPHPNPSHNILSHLPVGVLSTRGGYFFYKVTLDGAPWCSGPQCPRQKLTFQPGSCLFTQAHPGRVRSSLGFQLKHSVNYLTCQASSLDLAQGGNRKSTGLSYSLEKHCTSGISSAAHPFFPAVRAAKDLGYYTGCFR